MSDKFEKYYKSIENEALALKTGHVKSASTVVTQSHHVNLSIPMKLYDIAQTMAIGSKYAMITISPTDDTVMLSMSCISSLADVQKYNFTLARFYDGESVADMKNLVAILGGEYTDIVERLKRGESVTVNFGVDIVTTSDVEISVTYEDTN